MPRRISPHTVTLVLTQDQPTNTNSTEVQVFVQLLRDKAMAPTADISDHNDDAYMAARRMVQNLFASPNKLLRDLGTASNKAQTKFLGKRSAAIQIEAPYLTTSHTYDETWRWVPAEMAMSSASNPSNYQAVRDVLRARDGYQPPTRKRVTAIHLLETTHPKTRQEQARLARPVQVIDIDESTNSSITKAYLKLLKQLHQGKVERDPALLERLIVETRVCARARGAHSATDDDVRAAVQIVTSGLEHTSEHLTA